MTITNNYVEVYPVDAIRANGEKRDSVDWVQHPPHYGGRDDHYEAIKVIEAWGLGFHLGNAVKYISRLGKKGDALEDAKKARWYLDRWIEREEARRSSAS